MKNFERILIINLLLLVTVCGCKNDPFKADISDTPLDFSIKRFDRELFTMDLDTIDSAIGQFYQTYGSFFDAYNVHVINIGDASGKYYDSYLSMFREDPQNRAVYEYVQGVFPDMEDQEKMLGEAFKRYAYFYPDSVIPAVVAYVGGFNHKLFTVDHSIGIGLDQYLGEENPFYDMLGTPSYLQRRMYPANIAPDVINVWGSALYPYNDSVDHILSRVVYQGLLYFFTSVLLPEVDEATLLGFTQDELRFCRSNEKQMWTYLIEHKLLFSTDALEIRKLTDDAPSTYYFPDESPGRAVVYLGLQMVREYVKRHPKATLDQVMSISNYQTILSGSGYNP